MSANAARIELTPEEREERAALRRRLDRQFGQPRAEVVPIDRAKKPLGLGIVLDDDERAAARNEEDPTNGWKGFHFHDKHDAAFLESAVSFAWLFHFLDIVGGALLGVHNDGVKEVNDLWDDVQRVIKKSEAAQRVERRLEVAELKVLVSELKAEVMSLRSIQETLRISSRGERGEPGPRGIAGAQGPVGPAGPQGPRGAEAATIIEWESEPQRFVLTPILGNGARGVSAHLLPFFEAYDASVRDDEE